MRGWLMYHPAYSRNLVQCTLTIHSWYHTHRKLIFNWWLMHPPAYMYSPAQHLNWDQIWAWQCPIKRFHLLSYSSSPTPSINVGGGDLGSLYNITYDQCCIRGERVPFSLSRTRSIQPNCFSRIVVIFY